MDVATFINGVPIRLTDERWQHMVTNRNNLVDLKDEVRMTVSEPDSVVEKDDGALIAVKASIMRWSLSIVKSPTPMASSSRLG